MGQGEVPGAVTAALQPFTNTEASQSSVVAMQTCWQRTYVAGTVAYLMLVSTWLPLYHDDCTVTYITVQRTRFLIYLKVPDHRADGHEVFRTLGPQRNICVGRVKENIVQ